MDFRRNQLEPQKTKLNWQLKLKNGTTMKSKQTKLTSFSDHLDQQYGKRGTENRERYEEEFEAFKVGVLIQELRKERGMTQEQLAIKCGTTKNYISRIENNASDIRLSTLMRIIREGLGAHLTLRVS
jgi:HTH-type transcriptional regulator/antitoxin HipB